MEFLFRKVMKGAGYAIDGIVTSFRYEISFRWEIILGCLILPSLFFLGRTWVERSLLMIPLAMVWSCELLNTALEKTIDHLGHNTYHPMLKWAKDAASAAVFISVLLGIFIWGSALWKWLRD